MQQQSLAKLMEYYTTEELRKFDKYNMIMIQETEARVDTVTVSSKSTMTHLGTKEFLRDLCQQKTSSRPRNFGVLGEQAGWFEEHPPKAEAHKRENVTGVSYKIINAFIESGDMSLSTALGIILSNANWNRVAYGSKSVSLGNIAKAYAEADKHSGVLNESIYQNTMD